MQSRLRNEGISFAELPKSVRQRVILYSQAGSDRFYEDMKPHFPNLSRTDPMIVVPWEKGGTVRYTAGTVQLECDGHTQSTSISTDSGAWLADLEKKRAESERRAKSVFVYSTGKFETRDEDAKKLPDFQINITLPPLKNATVAQTMREIHKLYPKIAYICKSDKPRSLRADIGFDNVPLGDVLDTLGEKFQIGWEWRPMGVLVLRNPDQESRLLPVQPTPGMTLPPP